MGVLGRYGSLVRLLTEEPPRLAEADLIRMQRGQCAACRAPLPTPVKQSSFLGSRSTATVHAGSSSSSHPCMPAFTWTHLNETC